MDPKACLIEAEEFVGQSGMRDECAYRLAEYFRWRIEGGFNPDFGHGVDGDSKATIILAKLGKVADTLSAALTGGHNAS